MQAQRTLNRLPIPILTYHQVDEAPPRGSPFRSLCVSPSNFRRQMAALHLLGYKGLSMTDLLPYLRGERVGKVFGITLDDGYENNLTNALPVLQRYGFTATCYVVSQLIGKTNVWDKDLGIREASLMDASQLRRWLDGGQEIGAHTRHHVRLPQLDKERCEQEIFNCKVELESLLGTKVNHFCYPFGEFASAHVEMAFQAGYLTATTTRRGRCQNGEDPMQLPRVPVVRTTTLVSLWLKLATAYENKRSA
jgi:peptidoglycan/xylan/chitin deacetylase (PgdA/CDA1 family)